MQPNISRSTGTIRGALGAAGLIAVAVAVAMLLWPGESGTPPSDSTSVAGDDTPATGDAVLDEAMTEARDTLAALDGESSADTNPAQTESSATPTAPGPRVLPSGADTDDPDAPRFDVVRVEPDGEAVFAGRAAPNATVTILDAGEELGRTKADARGEWVFIPDTPLPPGERALSLVSRGGHLRGTAATGSGSGAAETQPTAEAGLTASKPVATDEPMLANALSETEPADAGNVPPDGSDTTAAETRPPDGTASAEHSVTVTASASPPVAAEGAAITTAPSPSVQMAAVATPGRGDPVPATAAPVSLASPANLGATATSVPEADTDPTLRRSASVVVLSIPEAPGSGPVLALEQHRDSPSTSRVLQGPAMPAAEGRLNIGTVDYTARGGLTLSGTASPGATVQLYLDNEPLALTVTDASGAWTATPERADEIAARLYTLRADEVDAEGTVARRVELPFQRADLDLRPNAKGETLVVVQPGNNLWTVARVIYGRGIAYTTIYKANNDQIRDPDLIYPGQVFVIPETAAETDASN